MAETNDDLREVDNEYYSEEDDSVDFVRPLQPLDTSMNNAIIVDNLPNATKEKMPRLESLVKDVAQKAGKLTEEGFYIPVDDNGASKGYAFLEFQTRRQAEAAVEEFNGLSISKTRQLKCNPLVDFDHFISVPDELKTRLPKYERKPPVHKWLLDPRGRNQFLCFHEDVVSMSWFDPHQKTEGYFSRKAFSDSAPEWSPMGNFLASIHRQGVQIHCGSEFNVCGQFSHPDVGLVTFSPKENFLLTSSSTFGEGRSILWDLRTNKKLKQFRDTVPSRRSGSGAPGAGGLDNDEVFDSDSSRPDWRLKFSNDEKYLAQIGNDYIDIFTLGDDISSPPRRLDSPGIRHFAWSPTVPLLALWIPSTDADKPARVAIYDVENDEEIKAKPYFKCSEACTLIWSPTGKYLAVKIEKQITKHKKETGLEVFRVGEKSIPIEVIEIPRDEPILDNLKPNFFSWEPTGHRFCVIHGELPRVKVSVFTMKASGGKMKLLGTLENRSISQIHWSPRGQYFVLTGLGSLNGVLEFWDANTLDCLTVTEDAMASEVTWDPSGLYLASLVLSPKQSVENGYKIWTFQGKMTESGFLDKLFMFAWRPRMKSLLSKKEEEVLRKTLGDYSDKFEEEDIKWKASEREEQSKRRAKLEVEFSRWRADKMRQVEEERRIRISLRDGYDSDDEDRFQYVNEEVEEVIESKTVVLGEVTNEEREVEERGQEQKE